MANKHQWLIEKGEEFVQMREDGEQTDSSSSCEPDICLEDSSFFDAEDFSEVWLEAEASSISRPSNIIEKVSDAARSNAKLVFLVSAVQNKRVDYHANRIDNIISSPILRSRYWDEKMYVLYNSNDPLRTEEGHTVLTKQPDEWVYNEIDRELWYGDITIQNPESGLKLTDDRIPTYGYETDNGYTVVENGDSSVFRSISDTEYTTVREPAYPFSIPRNRLDKITDSVEYLIFGDNVMYHRETPSLDTYIDGIQR